MKSLNFWTKLFHNTTDNIIQIQRTISSSNQKKKIFFDAIVISKIFEFECHENMLIALEYLKQSATYPL